MLFTPCQRCGELLKDGEALQTVYVKESGETKSICVCTKCSQNLNENESARLLTE